MAMGKSLWLNESQQMTAVGTSSARFEYYLLKPKEVEVKLAEVRRYGLSRSVGHPTPGVNSVSAPVFDYSGNIVLGITVMGSSGVFDPAWDGVQAQSVKACAAEVSRRLGFHPDLSSVEQRAAA